MLNSIIKTHSQTFKTGPANDLIWFHSEPESPSSGCDHYTFPLVLRNVINHKHSFLFFLSPLQKRLETKRAKTAGDTVSICVHPLQYITNDLHLGIFQPGAWYGFDTRDKWGKREGHEGGETACVWQEAFLNPTLIHHKWHLCTLKAW